jgi:hypothetical protein
LDSSQDTQNFEESLLTKHRNLRIQTMIDENYQISPEGLQEAQKS